ncbi:MAG: restriction endonuclease [Alteromonas sp.]|nr:restriction endonuclease [Alteromonas sp.]|tara:strand:- start:8328 stop:9590 length:1263 start_codon:yes stop_codon:yes gene_type:complete
MSALEQTVPQGYKQTLAGIIPEDWETGYLGDSAQFIGSGKTNTKNKGDFQLYGSTGVIGSCALPEYTGPSILVARVGANAGKLGFADGEYGVSDNTIIIRLHKNCNLKYFQYWLTRRNLNSLVFGSGQPLITGSQLKELLLPLPKIEEQTAIANALSDVDALLTELEKLIAKKQAIKTATMQQLLTGKTRLPQFATYTEGEKQGQTKGTKPSEIGEIPEDWDVNKLGELGKFKNGINKDADSFGHGSPFVNLMDVFGKPKISGTEDFGLINSTALEKKEYSISKGDVLFIRSSVKPSGVGLTSVALANIENAVYSGFLIRFRSNKKLDDNFKIHCFYDESFRTRIIAASTVSANTNINQDALKEIQIAYPTDINEQTAIATILSDMDNEIQTLEQRLAKTRQVKQGMMQELLTGRTRLPF